MLNRIAYENSRGEVVELNTGHFRCSEQVLKSFTWGYTFNTLPANRGGAVEAFYRDKRTLTFKVLCYGDTKEQTAELLNHFANVIEYDVRVNEAGRLWLGEQYLKCYFVAGQVTKSSNNRCICVKDFTILPTAAFWCTERTTSFTIGSGMQSSAGIKKYNNRYPYKYGAGYAAQTLYNDSESWETPAVITFYGPATNPSIRIAGNIYAFTAVIATNERVIIDQQAKRLYKVSATGVVTNMYPYRDKEHDIFKLIPAGSVDVVYSGDFGFDITLIHQRSEPYWM